MSMENPTNKNLSEETKIDPKKESQIDDIYERINQLRWKYHKERNNQPLTLNDAILLAKRALVDLGDDHSFIYERSEIPFKAIVKPNESIEEDYRKIYVLAGPPCWDGECAPRVDGDDIGRIVLARIDLTKNDFPLPTVEELLEREKDIQFKLIREGKTDIKEGPRLYRPEYHRTYRLRKLGSAAYETDQNMMWSPF